MGQRRALELCRSRHRRLEIPDARSTGRRPRPAASPSPSSRRPKAATASTTISTSTGAAPRPPACRARAYHFYYFCRPPPSRRAGSSSNVPNDRSALPPVLDMEWNPHSPTCKLRPPPRRCAARCASSSNRRKALRQEADHLHLGRLLRRQRPLELPRLSLLAALGRRPPAPEIRQPPLHLLAIHRNRRRSRHHAAMPTSTSSTAREAAWKSGCGRTRR